jgi:hypothetical protein
VNRGSFFVVFLGPWKLFHADEGDLDESNREQENMPAALFASFYFFSSEIQTK